MRYLDMKALSRWVEQLIEEGERYKRIPCIAGWSWSQFHSPFWDKSLLPSNIRKKKKEKLGWHQHHKFTTSKMALSMSIHLRQDCQPYIEYMMCFHSRSAHAIVNLRFQIYGLGKKVKSYEWMKLVGTKYIQFT